jgi:hypothetical protein
LTGKTMEIIARKQRMSYEQRCHTPTVFLPSHAARMVRFVSSTKGIRIDWGPRMPLGASDE